MHIKFVVKLLKFTQWNNSLSMSEREETFVCPVNLIGYYVLPVRWLKWSMCEYIRILLREHVKHTPDTV